MKINPATQSSTTAILVIVATVFHLSTILKFWAEVWRSDLDVNLKMFSWTHLQKELKTKKHKKCYRIIPLLEDKFIVTGPLAKEKDDAVSFQFKEKPRWYLRARERMCFIEPRKYHRHYGT